jgi:hypothetical protein
MQKHLCFRVGEYLTDGFVVLLGIGIARLGRIGTGFHAGRIEARERSENPIFRTVPPKIQNLGRCVHQKQ